MGCELVVRILKAYAEGAEHLPEKFTSQVRIKVHGARAVSRDICRLETVRAKQMSWQHLQPYRAIALIDSIVYLICSLMLMWKRANKDPRAYAPSISSGMRSREARTPSLSLVLKMKSVVGMIAPSSRQPAYSMKTLDIHPKSNVDTSERAQYHVS